MSGSPVVPTTLVVKARDGHRGLFLSVSGASRTGGMLSPYFQRQNTKKVGTDRNTHLFLKTMTRTGIIIGYGGDGYNLDVFVRSFNGNTSYGVDGIQFDDKSATDAASFIALAKAAAEDFATNNGFTWDTLFVAPGALDGAPQAAVADTTDISDAAVQLNALLAELRTLGLIST